MAANKVARILVGGTPTFEGTDMVPVIDCDKPIPGDPDHPPCHHGPPTSCFHGVACRGAVRASFRADDKIKTACIMCSAKANLRCGGCNDARYCSTTCRDLDKQMHKPFCESFSGGFQDNERPTAHHVRVVVFPQDKNTPAFAWAKPRTTVDGKVLEIKDARLAQYIADNQLGDHTLESVNYGVGLVPMGCGVNILWAGAEMDKLPSASPVSKQYIMNSAVASLAPAGHLKPVYAPGLAYAFESRAGVDMVKIKDMTFREARRVIDHILQSPFHPVVADVSRFKMTREIALFPAIRCNKTTDPNLQAIHITAGQEYESVTVALPRVRRSEYRPALFAFRAGLRYWTRMHVAADMLSHKELDIGYFHDFPARHSSAYIEVHRLEDSSHGPFRYVRHFSQVNRSTIIHGSGAAIPPPHMQAWSEWTALCDIMHNGTISGERHETPWPWPAWVAEALGPDDFARMCDVGDGKRSFALFWTAWKTWANLPADTESPHDFESRHADEAIFMEADGSWDGLDVGECSAHEMTLDAVAREEKRAVRAGGVNDERARESADYDLRLSLILKGVTTEKCILADLQKPNALSTASFVIDRPPAVEEAEPAERQD